VLQAKPFHDCPPGHALLATVHAPPPLRDSPGGQTGHGPLRHRTGRLNSALCTGFRKGWRNERDLFFSGAASPLAGGNLVDDVERGDEALVLPTCEVVMLEAWLLAELADEPPE